MTQSKSSTLPHEVIEAIERRLPNYPENQKRSVVLYALHAAQHAQGGYLTEELMDGVAAYLDMAPVAVYEVASFYSMLVTEPVGRHSISVCTNISCMLRGGEEVLEALEQHLGIRAGQSTPDGRIYLKHEEECLAACCGAPMMMVDHVYHENLTPQQACSIVDGLE